jgi:hypothetical protein
MSNAGPSFPVVASTTLLPWQLFIDLLFGLFGLLLLVALILCCCKKDIIRREKKWEAKGILEQKVRVFLKGCNLAIGS